MVGLGLADLDRRTHVCLIASRIVAGRRVLETFSQKVTTLPLPEALTASATRVALVSFASWNGLPVSTTHVSTGR